MYHVTSDGTLTFHANPTSNHPPESHFFCFLATGRVRVLGNNRCYRVFLEAVAKKTTSVCCGKQSRNLRNTFHFCLSPTTKAANSHLPLRTWEQSSSNKSEEFESLWCNSSICSTKESYRQVWWRLLDARWASLRWCQDATELQNNLMWQYMFHDVSMKMRLMPD